MQQVYRLLRDNCHTGPHSLEELIHFDLQPIDLIWIDGTSAGWYYPHEITALQPHLQYFKHLNPVNSRSTTNSNVYVSIPNLKSNGVTSFGADESVTDTQHSRPAEENETDSTSWSIRQKAERKNAISGKGLLVAAMVMCVAAACWFLFQKSEPEAAILPENETTLNPGNEVTLQEGLMVENEGAQPGDLPRTAATERNMAPPKQKNTARNSLKVVAETKQHPDLAAIKNEAEADSSSELIVQDETNAVSEKPTENTTVKKKKLKEKIIDLFRKDEQEKNKTSGRQVPTRDINLTKEVSVRLQVPNNWMMGIKGAKAIVVNRSKTDITGGAFELKYLNEDKELVDRKTIFFGSIKAGKMLTVSVPDHATATELEYEILSAKGGGESFVWR